MEKIVLVLLLLMLGSIHAVYIVTGNGDKPRDTAPAKLFGGIGLLGVVSSVSIGWLLTLYAMSGMACANNGCGGGWLVLLGAAILVPTFIISEFRGGPRNLNSAISGLPA